VFILFILQHWVRDFEIKKKHFEVGGIFSKFDDSEN